ncbi:MAG: methyltransferase domain-containing protein [Deltaproteobacteria bacterium]|jgi:tRNA (adenine57-N1/adenine58-N1)-methyltransferase
MPVRGVFEAGETVVFVDRRTRKYLKTLQPGHRITIRGTVINATDVIGKPEGSWFGHSEPESFLAFRPSPAELATTVQRKAEPVFPKDVGAILTHADLGSGDTVIEAGVGTGLLSVALLRALGPQGHLTSYEIRPEFAEHARANVKAFHGDSQNWTLRVQDARGGFEERNVDHVITDLPAPQDLLNVISKSLRPGGRLTSYLPGAGQVAELHAALAALPHFGLAETWEVLERSWHVEPDSIRPDHRMVAHTGFLTFARRLAT